MEARILLAFSAGVIVTSSVLAVEAAGGHTFLSSSVLHALLFALGFLVARTFAAEWAVRLVARHPGIPDFSGFSGLAAKLLEGFAVPPAREPRTRVAVAGRKPPAELPEDAAADPHPPGENSAVPPPAQIAEDL